MESHAGDVRAREVAHSRVLSAYIAAGLFFMLLPGTFLGVWNLLLVSARQSVDFVAPAWLQAHGHAQVFGWVGSFILGIGFYSIPLVRAGARPSLGAAWACWAIWITGVGMRWAANVYGWQWRVLVPASAGLELAAFVIFFRAVSQHRAPDAGSRRIDLWIRIVMTASIGLALTLTPNAATAGYVAWQGDSPALPHGLNQRFLVLVTSGFLAPFVWGFSSKWLPVLLGLRPAYGRILLSGVALNALGVLLTLMGWGAPATVLLLAASLLVAIGLCIFEPPLQAAKIRGVHASFPVFVRLAYAWLIIAAALGVAAAAWDESGGLWGASRHAFTVGFVSVMVFSIGQRVLPAFAAGGPLWSPRLMFSGLLLLTSGCLLRVSSEIAAYQYGVEWAWSALPISAVLELVAFTAFALNLIATFAFAPDFLPAPQSSTHGEVPS